MLFRMLSSVQARHMMVMSDARRRLFLHPALALSGRKWRGCRPKVAIFLGACE